MKKSELIAALQAMPGGDDIEVFVFDYLKNQNTDTGEGSSEGMYKAIEIDIHNHNLTDEEAEWYRELWDTDPIAFLTLGFKNPEEKDHSEEPKPAFLIQNKSCFDAAMKHMELINKPHVFKSKLVYKADYLYLLVEDNYFLFYTKRDIVEDVEKSGYHITPFSELFRLKRKEIQP